jgi:hypothetical protein
MNGSRAKQHKGKQAGQTGHLESTNAPGFVGPQASLLALQRAAGNSAVNELFDQNEQLQPKASNLPQPEPLSAGQGQPLESQTRGYMERLFGQDFSNVRLHTDSQAEESASEANAKAYTLGNSIVFSRGRYAPQTSDGKRLIAHELAHVVQQSRGGGVAGPAEISQLETAADQAGTKVASGSPGTITVAGAAAAGIMREPDDLNIDEAFKEHNPPQGKTTGQAPPMDPRHARGHVGEQTMGFGYSNDKGWIFVEGPSGKAGHGVTTKGFDGVAYNVKADELHIVDNKALRTQTTAYNATAITKNLKINLDTLIERVQGMKMPDPPQTRILQLLKQMQSAVASGTKIPSNTKLIITGEAGQVQAVGGKLNKTGVEVRESGTTDADLAKSQKNTPPTGKPTQAPSAAKPSQTPPAAKNQTPQAAKPAPTPQAAKPAQTPPAGATHNQPAAKPTQTPQASTSAAKGKTQAGASASQPVAPVATTPKAGAPTGQTPPAATTQGATNKTTPAAPTPPTPAPINAAKPQSSSATPSGKSATAPRPTSPATISPTAPRPTSPPPIRVSSAPMPPPRISFRNLATRGVVRGGKFAALAAVLFLAFPKLQKWLLDEPIKAHIDEQLTQLEPEINNRIMQEAEKGLAMYKRLNLVKDPDLHITITIDFQIWGMHDQDLRDYLYNVFPSVYLGNVTLGTMPIEGPGKVTFEEDIRLFTKAITWHHPSSYSIPLSTILSSFIDENYVTNMRLSGQPPAGLREYLMVRQRERSAEPDRAGMHASQYWSEQRGMIDSTDLDLVIWGHTERMSLNDVRAYLFQKEEQRKQAMGANASDPWSDTEKLLALAYGPFEDLVDYVYSKRPQNLDSLLWYAEDQQKRFEKTTDRFDTQKAGYWTSMVRYIKSLKQAADAQKADFWKAYGVK